MKKNMIVNFLNRASESTEEKTSAYPFEEPSAIEQIFDLTYSDGNKAHLFDIYRPIGKTTPQPTVINIHGGAWYSSYKEINKKFCLVLADQGFTVLSINYSLAPENGFIQQIKDIFAFFNWLEKNAQEFNIDLDKLFLCGNSAGGQLGALSLLTLGDNKRKAFFGVDSSIHFAGACFICGAFDVKKMAKMPCFSLFFNSLLGKGYARRAIIDEVDFFNAIPLDFPKTLLISSEEDYLVKQSIRAYDYLNKYGIECEKHIWGKSATEKRKLTHIFNVFYPTWEESIETNNMIGDFFKRIYRLKDRAEESDQ